MMSDGLLGGRIGMATTVYTAIIELAENRADVRPSQHDRCAECGTAVAGQWVSYRQDPDNPATLISHFGGIVTTGPAEPPPPTIPKPSVRDLEASPRLAKEIHRGSAHRSRAFRCEECSR